MIGCGPTHVAKKIIDDRNRNIKYLPLSGLVTSHQSFDRSHTEECCVPSEYNSQSWSPDHRVSKVESVHHHRDASIQELHGRTAHDQERESPAYRWALEYQLATVGLA